MQLSKCFVTFSTDSKLHPSTPMVLSSAFAVEAVKASLTKEIFALVTEKHSFFLRLIWTLNAAHQLPDLECFCSLGAIELPNQITIPDHEVLEVLHIFDRSLFLDNCRVVAKCLLQDMY